MIQRAHQRASWYGESTQGNQHCMKHSFGLVFMGRTSVGRYRPPVFFRQIALRTNPHFQANFQERKSHVTPHKHSQENKKKTLIFFSLSMPKRTGIQLHNKWLSLKNVSYSETNNCTSLSQQAIPLCCMALQENLHAKDYEH